MKCKEPPVATIFFSTSDSYRMCYWHQKLENPLPHPLPIRSLLPLAVIDLPIQSDSRQKGADRERMREQILSHVTCLSQSESREGICSRIRSLSAPICHVICLSQSEAQESPLVSAPESIRSREHLLPRASAPESIRSREHPLPRASAPESIRSRIRSREHPLPNFSKSDRSDVP